MKTLLAAALSLVASAGLMACDMDHAVLPEKGQAPAVHAKAKHKLAKGKAAKTVAEAPAPAPKI